MVAGPVATSAQSGVRSPMVKVHSIPDFWGSFAIWGSTGVNRQGHIFFGVTSNDDRGSGSAHLFEFDPATGTFTDRGNVVSELERLRLRRPGETQTKIHSRIIEGADGLQYFASMDEAGENDDGSKLPTWGGHLWRRTRAGAWQHLAATPEALIAVAAGGPYVYALGYFNHVLYQYDVRSGRMRSTVVGSAAGHVSRNFFADDRGHVFAPKVTAASAPEAALVEYDANLQAVATHPLGEYFEKGLNDSHGIVGIVPDGRGGWFFTTGKGRLYHEQPDDAGRSTLADLGWMDGRGPKYPASLFRNPGTGALYAVAMPSNDGGMEFEFIVRFDAGQATSRPLPYGSSGKFPGPALLYGSTSQDVQGRLYVVGSMNYKPVVLQVSPAD